MMTLKIGCINPNQYEYKKSPVILDETIERGTILDTQIEKMFPGIGKVIRNEENPREKFPSGKIVCYYA